MADTKTLSKNVEQIRESLMNLSVSEETHELARSVDALACVVYQMLKGNEDD